MRVGCYRARIDAVELTQILEMTVQNLKDLKSKKNEVEDAHVHKIFKKNNKRQDTNQDPHVLATTVVMQDI